MIQTLIIRILGDGRFIILIFKINLLRKEIYPYDFLLFCGADSM